MYLLVTKIEFKHNLKPKKKNLKKEKVHLTLEINSNHYYSFLNLCLLSLIINHLSFLNDNIICILK